MEGNVGPSSVLVTALCFREDYLPVATLQTAVAVRADNATASEPEWPHIFSDRCELHKPRSNVYVTSHALE
jgi:hypothetical protein